MITKYPIVEKSYNILKRECCFCDRKYRFGGFKIKEYNKFTNMIFYSYCCNKCASNKGEVRIKIHELIRKRRGC